MMLGNSYIHLDDNHVQTMMNLGATRASYGHTTKYNYATGTFTPVPFTTLIYFWNNQGTEIGYWCSVGNNLHVHPSPRVWCDQFKEDQHFLDLTPPGEPQCCSPSSSSPPPGSVPDC